MIKLIASDVDGTLMREGERVIPPALFPLIHTMKENDIYFAACSGRQYANLRRLFAPVADDIGYICENGSLTMHRGQAVGCEVLDRARALELLRFIQQQPECEGLLSTQKCCYVVPKSEEYVRHVREVVGNDTEIAGDWDEIPEDFIKISLYAPEGDLPAIQKRMAAFSEPYQTPVLGGYGWIDFLREGCSKGAALRKYCEFRGINPGEVIGIGDNENDLALLETVGEMWAVENGHPNLKARAKRTVGSAIDELDRLASRLEEQRA